VFNENYEPMFIGVNGNTNAVKFFAILDNVPSETKEFTMDSSMIHHCITSSISLVENDMDPKNPDVYNYSLNINEIRTNGKDTSYQSSDLQSFYPRELPEPDRSIWRMEWLRSKIQDKLLDMSTCEYGGQEFNDLRNTFEEYSMELYRLKHK
jgi:hypothetical protein